MHTAGHPCCLALGQACDISFGGGKRGTEGAEVTQEEGWKQAAEPIGDHEFEKYINRFLGDQSTKKSQIRDYLKKKEASWQVGPGDYLALSSSLGKGCGRPLSRRVAYVHRENPE